ncbi:hypothetical protein [Phyllobacterium zundukense]|uniref:Uncharacterized protein n=1 Tax=Phyllobacterium zundukense TaxID=1867719 RepID=A0A2N9VQU1_9HYPH|nr:hypothetical protein [Phyllobacterium zundukense]ATU92294.1 hypothetical protein BLM14_12095 [Phyllobacterium zundukense]PIO41859.1 hypothetical protein B5P45_22535 [Phyllobacterium zundukense]
MKDRSNPIVALLNDQSAVIKQLHIDYAVERTVLSAVLMMIAVRGLIHDIDFEIIPNLEQTTHSKSFATLFANRLAAVRSEVTTFAR